MRKILLLLVVLVLVVIGIKTFGHSSGTDPRITAAHDQLIGAWQSEEDSQFVREFRVDGTVVDTHQGFAKTITTPGTWSLFTSDTTEPVQFQMNNYDVYIKQVSGTDTMYFRIGKVNATELELVYMDRGGVLKFSKV